MSSPWLDYLGRLEIIHIRDRIDRYSALVHELARIGIDIHDNRIQIPDAPRPAEAYGFLRGRFSGTFSAISISFVGPVMSNTGLS